MTFPMTFVVHLHGFNLPSLLCSFPALVLPLSSGAPCVRKWKEKAEVSFELGRGKANIEVPSICTLSPRRVHHFRLLAPLLIHGSAVKGAQRCSTSFNAVYLSAFVVRFARTCGVRSESVYPPISITGVKEIGNQLTEEGFLHID